MAKQVAKIFKVCLAILHEKLCKIMHESLKGKAGLKYWLALCESYNRKNSSLMTSVKNWE